MRHIRHILIEEMSFIGPRLCIQIDSHLREAFPENKDYPFGGSFIILVGDLGKLPLVKDKPLYVGIINRNFLWESFSIVVTLDKIYMQQGDNLRQVYFHNLLTNIGNENSFLAH